MAPKKRGRPVGWRKKNAMRSSVMVRLSSSVAAWLVWAARREGVGRSEVVRRLIIARKEAWEKGRSK